MKYIIPILTMIAACFLSFSAFAQSTEVDLSVEYDSHRIDVTLKDNDPQAILVNAVKRGCKQLCTEESCENDCFQQAKLTLLRCVDDNNIKCRPNQEKLIVDHLVVHNAMLQNDDDNKIDLHKALASKSRNNINDSKNLIPVDYYPSNPNNTLIDIKYKKQSSSTLLLTNWRGNQEKKKVKKNRALLIEQRPQKLFPSHGKKNFLLK